MPHLFLRKKLTITGLLIFSILISNFLHAQVTGRVVAIADGDTFTLLTADNQQLKVRLHGIDCPERKQPYYQQAKSYTSSLVYGQQVSLVQKGKDRYKRIIAMAFTTKGVNVNEALLKAGMAWHYTKYDTNPYWASLQQNARRQKLGLWKDANPIAPWDWRKR